MTRRVRSLDSATRSSSEDKKAISFGITPGLSSSAIFYVCVWDRERKIKLLSLLCSALLLMACDGVIKVVVIFGSYFVFLYFYFYLISIFCFSI